MTLPKQILTQHVAVLGKTGSGKTSTAKLAIEQVVAEGARVCVLDPIKSDWWGLTSSADGKREGLPFHILGGPRGHVPLHSSAGKAVAEIVASGQLPLSIIDMAEFEPGGQAKFFVDFAPTLLRKMRGVVYLVVEEAHIFAPKERSGIGQENMSIHWAKTIATAGRSKGVRLVLLSQRTQALHNALLGSCDTLIAHRLTAPADQEPVLKWLKANTTKEVLERVSSELSSLKTGDGWICSGEAKVFTRVHFPRIKTYDNTATPTGDGDVRDVKTAAVDQEKLRAIIGDAVEKAKQEDPRELRKQLAEANRMLFNQAKTIGELQARPPAGKEKRVEVPVLKDAQIERVEKLVHRFDQALTKAMGQHAAVCDQLQRLVSAVHAVRRDAANVGRTRTDAPARTSPPPPPRARVVAAGGGDASVGNSGLRRMLVALAQRPNGLTRGQLGVRARVSAKGGSFDTYLSKARVNGWIDSTGERIRITDAGLTALGTYEPLPEGRELLQHYVAEFGNSGAARMLQALADIYPKSYTRAELGEVSNVSAAGGSFDTYLSKLRTLELIEGKTEIRLSGELV